MSEYHDKRDRLLSPLRTRVIRQQRWLPDSPEPPTENFIPRARGSEPGVPSEEAHPFSGSRDEPRQVPFMSMTSEEQIIWEMDDWPARDRLLPGTLVGKEYRIEKVIGVGGFGVVYQAFNPRLEHQVAIKVLDRRLSQDPEWVERFRREVIAVNRIRHRHVVEVWSQDFLADGRAYYVMTLLDGKTLFQRLDEVEGERLSFTEALPIFRAIASALDAAHDIDIIHRDLKPENVFITGDREIKVLDFGIAKVSAQGCGHDTETGTLQAGTPRYMSPEQIICGPITRQSDIYALGVLVFRTLTGQFPIDEGRMDIRKAHLTEAPRIPSSLIPTLRSMDEAILHMLAKNSKDRPISASRAVDALARAYRPTTVRHIRRAPDTTVEKLARCQGVTLILQGPRGFGKHALLERYMRLCAAEHKERVHVDFEQFDAAVLASYSVFLRELGMSLAHELDVTGDFDNAVTNLKFSRLVDKLQAQVDSPIVLILDHIECLFDAPYRDDFFSMVRSWHNRRMKGANGRRRNRWLSTDIVLVTSGDPNLLIIDPSMSPFNVGTTIKLGPLSVVESLDLNDIFGSPLGERDARALHRRLGGHPELTHMAYQFLERTGRADDRDIADSVRRFVSSDPVFDKFVNRFRKRVDLLEFFRVFAKNPRHRTDHKVTQELLSAGLIRMDGTDVVPASPIFVELFRQ